MVARIDSSTKSKNGTCLSDYKDGCESLPDDNIKGHLVAWLQELYGNAKIIF